MALPEQIKEETRGGTEATKPKPIEEPGQSITIDDTPSGESSYFWPETPSLAKEFLEQLEKSKAPNGCIMLPGNLQYWQPCKWLHKHEYGEYTFCGTIRY